MNKLILILSCLAAQAQAFELLNPTIETTWGQGSVPFYLHLGNYNELAKLKLADWSQYMGATSLAGTSSTLTPDWMNGRNDIAWSVDEHLNFTWPSNILAITLPNFDWQTGRMIETDIVFNSSFAFASYDGPLHYPYDIGRILLHEIGHSIGLGHSTEPSVMIGNTSNIYQLTADDIAGARFLYSNQSVPDTGSTLGLLMVGLAIIGLFRTTHKTKKEPRTK